MKHSNVTNMIAVLREKAILHIQYIDRLEQSVAILMLVPGAFDKGKIITQVTGNSREPDKMKFTIKTGVKEYTFPLWEVPTVLWFTYLEEIITHGHNTPRKYVDRYREYNQERKLL